MKNVALSRLTLGIICLALTASCRSPLSGLAGPVGVLTITLPSGAGARGPGAAEASARSLAAHAGTIATWRLEGAGPQGRTYEGEFTAEQVTSNDNTVTIELALGDWTITIRGLDTDGAVTFTATQAVKVKADEPATCAMTLAWAEKALVARLSFDASLQDEKARITTTPSVPGWVPIESTAYRSLNGTNYLQFNGTSHLDLSSIDLGTEFSVAFWIQTHGTGDLILASSRKAADDSGFTLRRLSNGEIRLETGLGNDITTGIAVPDNGVWYHIALTIQASTGGAALYVNGSQKLAATVSPIDPRLGIRLGASYTGASFHGLMEDLRLYSGILEATEIELMYRSAYFAGGSGTNTDPYLVSNPAQLYNVRLFPNAHYRQTARLDLSSTDETNPWTPIPSFSGSYDGGSQSISNVILDGQTEENIGFFRVISNGGNVRNLAFDTVTGVSTSSSTTSQLGALAGRIENATVSDIRIEGINLTGKSRIGGLAGKCVGTSLSRIETFGEIAFSGELSGSTLVTRFIGGIAGELAGTIHSCTAAVSITPTPGTQANTQDIGGFAGWIHDPSNVSNCRSVGDVSSGQSTGGQSIGGFAGQISLQSGSNVSIKNCSSSGLVESTKAR